MLRLLGAMARTTADGLDATFARALRDLGRFAHADRCYIFEVQPDATVRNTFEWVEDGIAPEIDNLSAVPVDALTEWFEVFREGQPVHLPDVAALPGTSTVKPLLEAQGIRAVLVVPFADDSGVHGFIGFDNNRTTGSFPGEVVALLAAAADLVWGTLSRVRADRLQQETTDRMSALLAAMPDLVFELDAGGRYTGRAAGPTDMMIVPVEERIGRHISDVLPPHVAAEFAAGMEEAEGGMVSRPRRYRIEHNDRRLWHEVVFAPIGTEGGVMCHIRDVTRDEMARRRLERLGKAAEMMTNHVVLTDRAGTVLWANRAFIERSGWALDEMLGHPIYDFTRSPNTDPEIAARIARAMEAGSQFTGELVNRTREGEDYWVDLNISEARDLSHGDPVVINVATDVTELKRTRDRLANIIDGAAAGTWDWKRGRDRVRVNERFAQILNRPHAELADIPVMDLMALIVDEDRENVLAVLERLRVGAGATFDTEFRMRAADGTPVWVEVRGRVMARRADGMADSVAGVLMDISERKAAEEELRCINARLQDAIEHREAAERRFRDIAAISDDWFFELDAELGHVYVSENFENIVGTCASEMLGRPLRDLAGLAVDEADWPSLEAELAARRPYTGFLFARRSEQGARSWLRLSLTPHFRASDGGFLGYRGVGSDVTALNAERLRALDASRAKGKLLATMSHEIRTPLNSILGMAELMEAHVTGDRQREMLATIRGSGEMLVGMLNNLLDMSKIEAGQLELASQPLNLRRLVEGASRIYAAQAQSRGIDFDLLLGPGADAGRVGDAHRLQQVLQNLVSNAFKFTSEGRVAVRLSARPGKPVIIEVSDTGIGMTDDQVRTVFDPYQQADSQIVARFGGTGLGLSIVRELVALMAGTIDVKSAPGEGTTFRITLPLAEVPLPAGVDAADAAAGEPRPDQVLAGRRILIADDSATNLAVATGMLHETGIDLVRAEDGGQAVDLWLEASRTSRFDLLLLDIAMPRVDGVTTLARIRAAEAAANLPPAPAVAVTANVMTEQVVDYVLAGFDSVLAKPFRKSELHAVLHTLLPPPADGPALSPAAPRRRVALPSVLLADDDAITREIFAEFLNGIGQFDVVAVEDGRQALTAALRRPFGLIVIDRKMPELSGDRVIRALRGSETPNRATAMVLATGDVTDLRAGSPARAEPDLYLPKPIDSRLFARAVRTLMGTE
ncbi:hypothetical protein RISW2_03940 [Roseivivax isoporae LMG 25204]|uniref:histidine kinase n=1 Tax=Roseivivax isoporae LMG 25204 TaxID=1449351 RepID=X7F9U2_9RHOB|nr:hypothetical protein RISW2_03940 [Roseivivax isoporae LMG 25204]